MITQRCGKQPSKELLFLFLFGQKKKNDETQQSEAATMVASSFIDCLGKKLESNGLSLIFRRGNSFEELTSICKQTKADAVFFGERYEPSIIRRDNTIAKNLLS